VLRAPIDHPSVISKFVTPHGLIHVLFPAMFPSCLDVAQPVACWDLLRADWLLSESWLAIGSPRIWPAFYSPWRGVYLFVDWRLCFVVFGMYIPQLVLQLPVATFSSIQHSADEVTLNLLNYVSGKLSKFKNKFFID